MSPFNDIVCKLSMKALANYKRVKNTVINIKKAKRWEIKSFCKEHSSLGIYVIAFFVGSIIFFDGISILSEWIFDMDGKILLLCITALVGIILSINAVSNIKKPRWKKIKSFCKKHAELGIYVIAAFIILLDSFIFFGEISMASEWVFDMDNKILLLYVTALVGMIIVFMWIARSPTFLIIFSIIALVILIIPLIIVIFQLPLSPKICTLLDTDSRNEAIRFIAIGMGGVVAAILAALVNRRAIAQEHNNELLRKENDDVRFQDIIKGLGHNKAAVRITAFYRFFYLAEKEQSTDEKTEKFRGDVFEILCGCLRGISGGIFNTGRDEHEYQIERQALFDVLFKKFRGNMKDGQNFMPLESFVDLHKVHLAELNLSGVDLSGVNFSGANLSNTNLSGANLSGANLSNAILPGANLSGANLSRTNLSNAVLSGADFSGAKFSKTVLSGAVLSGAILSGMNLSATVLSDMDLSDADLSGTDLSRTDLLRTDLSGAVLSGAVLSMANLSDANLSNTNLSNTIFLGADLSRADMTDANLEQANLMKTQLKGINFEDVSSIEHTKFYEAKTGERLISLDDLPKDKGTPIMN